MEIVLTNSEIRAILVGCQSNSLLFAIRNSQLNTTNRLIAQFIISGFQATIALKISGLKLVVSSSSTNFNCELRIANCELLRDAISIVADIVQAIDNLENPQQDSYGTGN